MGRGWLDGSREERSYRGNRGVYIWQLFIMITLDYSPQITTNKENINSILPLFKLQLRSFRPASSDARRQMNSVYFTCYFSHFFVASSRGELGGIGWVQSRHCRRQTVCGELLGCPRDGRLSRDLFAKGCMLFSLQFLHRHASQCPESHILYCLNCLKYGSISFDLI